MAPPEALDDVLARREERVLSKALARRCARVALHHFIGGGMTVSYKDRILQVTAYGNLPRP